jgi:glycine/D-amino acid oxidase-like deaminating enzyme
MDNKKPVVNRRDFLKRSAVVGAGATTLAGQAAAQGRRGQIHFDQVADVVVVGAGASGLPAAIMAREQGAAVIVIDSNHDIGGHAMLSGGRIPLGGGTRLQKKFGITDSADVHSVQLKAPSMTGGRMADAASRGKTVCDPNPVVASGMSRGAAALGAVSALISAL